MQYANLNQETPTTHSLSPNRRRRKRRTKHLVLIIVVFFLAVFLFRFGSIMPQIFKLIMAGPSLVFSVVTNSEPGLDSTDGRVNTLILGTGGGDHDGPDLSDTIIVASTDVKTGSTVLFSLPRDVYSEEAQTKINGIYAENVKKGRGLSETKKILGGYVGLPIHYAIRVDFDGFIKAVDTMGGIDVNVANSFDDYLYPSEDKEHDTCGFVIQTDTQTKVLAPNTSANPGPEPTTTSSLEQVYYNPSTGKKIFFNEVSDANNPYACRYEHIHYDKGLQHMDGKTALKYVRSRKGTNGEGSDFARSRRQQAVILAFRQALISKETLFDLGRIQELAETFGESIDTDVAGSEMGDFYQLFNRIKKAPIKTIALTDDGDGGEPVFYHPNDLASYGGAWVLLPKGNDWQVVRDAVMQAIAPPSPSPTVAN